MYERMSRDIQFHGHGGSLYHLISLHQLLPYSILHSMFFPSSTLTHLLVAHATLAAMERCARESIRGIPQERDGVRVRTVPVMLIPHDEPVREAVQAHQLAERLPDGGLMHCREVQPGYIVSLFRNSFHMPTLHYRSPSFAL